MPASTPDASLERHLAEFVFRRLALAPPTEEQRRELVGRIAAELGRVGPDEAERRALGRGGRAAARRALGLRLERALAVGAGPLGDWPPLEVRIDADATEAGTRGTAGARELLVVTRGSGRPEAPTAEGGGAPSLRIVTASHREAATEALERAGEYATVRAELDTGATLIAIREHGRTLAAELGEVRLLALGSDFDRLLTPVAEAVTGAPLATAAARSAAPPHGANVGVSVGDVLDGKYALVEKLGEGGFGAVYRAIDRDLDTEVAVKLLRSELAAADGALEEFRAEARRVAKLDHPSIVGWKGFNAGSDAGPYFVMEFLRGQELDPVLRTEGPLPLDRARALLRQVLQALVAAHFPQSGERVLHLDLKPQNIFLTQAADGGEAAKVIDFGIGRLSGRAGERGLAQGPGRAAESRLATLAVTSREGDTEVSVACTPEYASPEQARNMLARRPVVPLDDRSDLYSFGVVAFELLTGELPFERLPRGERLRYLDHHLGTPPRRVRDLRPEVERPLAEFVERCLAKEPDDRFPTSRDALAALEKLLARRGHTALATVSIVAALVIGLLSTLLVLGGGSTAAPIEVAAVRAGTARALASPTWVDASDPRGLELALPEGLVPRLETLDDPHAAPAGWNLEPLAEAGRFRLRPPQVSDRLRLRARIAADTEDGARASAPFELIALGPRAVAVGDLRVGGARVDADVPLRVSPVGLGLTVELRARAEDVVRVELGGDAEGVGWTRLGGPTELGDGRCRFTVALAGLGLGSGAARRELRVQDAAGRLRRGLAELAFEVVPPRPSAPWVDLADLPRVDGRLLLTPELDLDLTIHADPGSELLLAIERPDALGAQRPTVDRVGPSGTVQWRLPPGLRRDERGELLPAHEGRLRLGARHGDDVLLADRREAVSREVTLDFLYQPDPPGIEVPRFAGAVELEDGRQVLAAAETELTLTPSHASTTRVTLDLVAPSGGSVAGFPRTLELRDRPWTAPLALADLGAHELSVAVGRPGMTGDEALVRRTVTLVRVPARIAAEFRPDAERSAGELLRVGSDRPFPRPAVVLAEPAVVPVEAHAVLEDGRAGRSFRWSGRLGPDGGAFELALDEALDAAQISDGVHDLRFELDDPLGRRPVGAGRRFGVEVARRPPAAEVRFPRADDRSWGSLENGVFRAAVAIEDPNGIALEGARLALHAPGEPALGPRTEGLELVRGDGFDGEFEARFRLDHRWSARRVDLTLEVSDRRGNRVEALTLLRDCRLDVIEKRLPTWIAVEPPGGSVAPTPMALVRSPGDRSRFEFGKPLPGEYDTVELQIDSDEFEPFYLDRDEVTVEQFVAFLRDPDGYLDPVHWPATPASDASVEPIAPHPARAPEAARTRRDALERRLEAADGRAPATGVQWAEAFAYARYAGKRLQSELEWQWAVRGGRRERVWSGEGHGAWQAVAAQLGADRALAVDDYLDVSLEGLRGLCSGVDEWTATPAFFDGGEPHRGGSRRALVADPANRAAFVRPWDRVLDRMRVVVVGHHAALEEAPSYNQVRVLDGRSTRRADRVGFRCSLSVARYEALLDARAARPLTGAEPPPDGR